jgi:nicotinate-nucleotide adenylyltransferase
MEENKRTGLLFGSFNPVHTGHLIIAGYMAEYTDLSEIWFVVTPHNPLKDKDSLLDDHQRLHMVNLAIEGDSRFRSCDIEFRMPRPSFTIKTLTFLQEKYPAREFVIISGTDIFPSFHKWKNWEMLLEYYKFYVYPRPGSADHELTGHPSVKVFHAPMVEISSTFIRQSLRHGKNMRYYLPDKVFDYIREMHFYKK